MSPEAYPKRTPLTIYFGGALQRLRSGERIVQTLRQARVLEWREDPLETPETHAQCPGSCVGVHSVSSGPSALCCELQGPSKCGPQGWSLHLCVTYSPAYLPPWDVVRTKHAPAHHPH